MTDVDIGAMRRNKLMSILPHLVHEREICEPYIDGPWTPKLEMLFPIFTEEVGYKTGSGNMMSLLVEAYRVDRSQIPLLTEYEHISFCGNCRGSSGGCPGFAPRFETIKPKCSDFVIITISIDMIWAIMYATPKDGWLSNRILRQLMYADRITESYCKRLFTFFKGVNAGFPLGAGNCVGCRPKFCTVIRGNKCAKPRKRSYSMEAVGVDCDELHIMLYGEPLPWYYKGTSKMMTYMTRYIGLFPNESAISIVDYLEGFTANDRSYIDIGEVPESRDATISLMEIPSGFYKGGHVYVYNDPGLISKVEQV